jgi:hypothetical protein
MQSAHAEVQEIKFRQEKALYKSKLQKEHLMENTVLYRTEKTRAMDTPHLLQCKTKFLP